MIVPGIVSATFKTRSAEDVIALASKAKLCAIEWSENHHIPKGDLERAKEIASLTRDSGLEIAFQDREYIVAKIYVFISSYR